MTPVTDIKNPEKTSSWKANKEEVAAFSPATPGQIATKLERLRRDNGYTLHEAAKLAGISYSTLNRLERGRWLSLSVRDLNRRQRYGRAIARLAVAYEVKVEDILLIADYDNNRKLGGRS